MHPHRAEVSSHATRGSGGIPHAPAARCQLVTRSTQCGVLHTPFAASRDEYAPTRMSTGALERVSTPAVARPAEPNFLIAWLYRWVFAKIDVDPVWVRAVRDAAARGTVVYVMRSRSYVDFVALDFFLKRYSLPLIRFVSAFGLWLLEPFARIVRQLFSRREPEQVQLQRAVDGGFSALLFMRQPQAATANKRRGDVADADYVRVLIERQREQERPILLVPQVFVWGKRPDSLRKGMFDQVFGPQEYPGWLRTFAQVLWHYGNAQLRACEPVDLKAFLAENASLDEESLLNKIHWLLVTRLDRERRVVLGPVSKGPDRLKQEILRNPRIREAVADTVRREKKPQAVVERQLRRDLERLEARINPVALNWAAKILDGVFNRIYQGIEVDQEGLQRIREQARKGPVILLPSHKSHLDYLLLSFVFYTHGLQCPLIAAGDNLAFWPAGPMLRRCGAFFIRRSFKGARLYTTLVDTYVRKVLKEGFAIEFFVEGGRSRSGKLLTPKVGLLSMVAEAADAANVEVAYVPISIGYEQIVEQRSYIEELSGGEKRKEDAGALLTKAPRVLTAKYGRAYVQVGQILHFNYQGQPQSLPPPPPDGEAVTARAAKRAALDKMHSRRSEVTSLASRVVYEINRVTPVTPTALVATALLANLRRGVARPELFARIDQLVTDLRRAGARFAESLAVQYEGSRRPYRVDAVDQALNVFQESALLQVHGSDADAIYQVPDDRRLALDYYKNNLIHFFLPTGLAATALLTHPDADDAGVRRSELADRAIDLAHLVRPEFQLKSDSDVEFDTALDRLVEGGEVTVAGDGRDAIVKPRVDGGGRERLVFHAGLLRNFVESYYVAARALELLLEAPMPAKDLLKKAIGTGERLFLTGEIAQREAVSKPNLENALQSFRDAGYILGGEGGSQRLATGHDTVDAVRAIEARFRGYLSS